MNLTQKNTSWLTLSLKVSRFVDRKNSFFVASLDGFVLSIDLFRVSTSIMKLVSKLEKTETPLTFAVRFGSNINSSVFRT